MALLRLQSTCNPTTIYLPPGTQVNLTSVNYPNNYPNNAQCEWNIIAKEAGKIVVSFLDFNLERNYDYLYIGHSPDVVSADLILSGTKGGSAPDIFATNESTLWITFVTDYSVTKRGFALLLQWENITDDLSCDNETHHTCDHHFLICFDKELVCDFENHCPMGDDEAMCNFCGDTLVDIRGYQSSNISYTTLTTSSREPSCFWIIQSHVGRIILINVIHYHFRRTWNYDVFAIGYGNDSFDVESVFLQRHQESAIFQTIAADGPLVWLEFISNKYKGDSNIFLVVSEEAPVTCDGQFPCDSGLQCVNEVDICDGFPNCWDFSDEIGCGKCNETGYLCRSDDCIHVDALCNGISECPDVYDELHCECKPRLWKRYVDDILEIVKDNQVDNLTDHLNNTDPTDSIKFTYEKEEQGRIPFLDTLIVRKEDGSVKLLVYRKATHTDQYLNFSSHHPIYHKLGVVRTLLDRMDKIVTEPEDRQKEEDNIKKALKMCGYPEWTVESVKKKIRDKPAKSSKTKTKDPSQQTKGLVVIPYVEGVAERANRVFRKHNIATAMKPNTSLRKLLVHPKDKIDSLDKTDCIYEIPCQNCDSTYVGETGRKLNTRLKEHQKETEKLERSKKNFTRQTRKESVTEQSKSAIADHAIQQNHVINWDDTKVLQKDSVYTRPIPLFIGSMCRQVGSL
ncbi:uncharacterized protein [Amphiura filiformis]|uniref:uncharacterized protein n=1 Tax=Amphiura filiformis TaxID=82378 RepID=UPI003B20F433